MSFTDLSLAAWAATAALWPALAFVVLGLVMLLHRAPSERMTSRLVNGSLFASMIAALLAVAAVVRSPNHAVSFEAGSWFYVGRYAFEAEFLFDGLSSTMMVLSSLVTFLIGRFSVNYLHREPGFARFFLLLAFFAAGMQLLVSAGSLDVMFGGWELVGLSSALLIAFFYERAQPVRASVRAFITYRLCDIGLLVGAVLLHHYAHTSEFAVAFGLQAWPEPPSLIAGWPATLLSLALLVATMGKSAQFPVGGWLPQAMEGPTPSSALFYGALSVHAGVYLLLRAEPIFAQSALASTATLVVGALTAITATMSWRVQSDVKSGLAYATMTQVGLMLVEIGLGFYSLALVHLVAHALLRTWQLLRAPSALRDAQAIRAAHGGVVPQPVAVAQHFVPDRWLIHFYRLAWDRFHVETVLERFLTQPLLRFGQRANRLEHFWVDALSVWGRQRTELEEGSAPHATPPKAEAEPSQRAS